MARRKTAAKTKSTTTKKKNGSANKNSTKDDEKIKGNQKNKSVTSPATTSTNKSTKTNINNNSSSSSGGGSNNMDELNINKSTKLLKSTTNEKLQLHLLNNIDIKNMTNHNHNNNTNHNNKNFNNQQQQQKNHHSTITSTTTTNSLTTLSTIQISENLIHRSSQQQQENSISSSTLLEPKNINSNSNNIDKINNNNSNSEILISKINCQSSNNNDKYLHKKFKRPASVTIIDNNDYINIKSPIITTSTANLINEHQQQQNNNNNNHRLSIDSIGGDGSCSSNNNNIGVKENIIGENLRNKINNLKILEISESFSSDNHLINNNNNYIGENGHDIISGNQKMNCNNIESDNIEYQQKENNLLSKLNSDEIVINKKPIIVDPKMSHLKLNPKKPRLKNPPSSSLSELNSSGIEIQKQQLNENLDYDIISGNQKKNYNNIESDNIEYQQQKQNNLICKLNSDDAITNKKSIMMDPKMSYLKLYPRKPKVKNPPPSKFNSSLSTIEIQQQQQLNESLDYNYIGKGSTKRSTIKNLATGSTEFHKQTNNDILKIVNNNININNKNINNNINSTISPTISNSMHNSTNFNIINNQKSYIKQDIDQQQQQQINSTTIAATITTPTILTGRHVCPYCNLNCTKPSVLQKHIRAHTNERPYPCDKCGIAFKTNSNYYKHCRSRSHLQRMKGVVDPQPNDDDGSFGSDQDQDPDLSNSSSDVISGTTSPLDERTSSPAVQQLQQHHHHHHHHNYHHNHQQNQLSSASSISSNSSSSSVQKNSNDKPYKPKFHNAALYKDENIVTTNTTLYHHRHQQSQPQPPQQQQQQQQSSSLSPYSNKQNQMTILPATSNLHNINNHISETLSSNYYSAQSQFIQQQQEQHQQILNNHTTYIHSHPSGINHHEQQQQQQLHRSQISVNCESAMVGVASIQPPHHQKNPYTQQISSSSFQQAVAPAYNPETTGITTIPLVVRDSTGSTSNFGGSNNSGGSLATATTGGGHQRNVEFLQEHISKLISQNQAIVENKEVLLQKKYPKQLNKQKSLSSLVIPTSSSSVIETGSISSITPLNSKLQLALASKQQQQQQQQQQHQHQQQLQILLQQNEEILNRNSHVMNGFLSYPNTSSSTASLQQTRVHTSSNNKNLTTNMTHQVSLESSTSSQQPLNLSKLSVIEPGETINKTPSPPISLAVKSAARKRSSDDILSSNNSTPTKTLAIHPQNPERSIIKHLLLNARGLGVPNGEGDDAVYTCPLCKLDFQTAEELKLHTSQYCQGGPSSAPISPVASPSYKYFRSNSINVNLPEFNNPTSLATLAKSSLLHGKNPLPLAKLAFYRLKTKQSNLILNQLNVSTGNTTNNPIISTSLNKNDETIQKLIDAPLPSPGPLLGKTPLVESYNPASNSDHKSEDVIITKVHEERNFPTTSNKDFYNAKKIKFDNLPGPITSLSANNYTPVHHPQSFFGGNINTNTIFESQSTPKPQFIMCSSGDIQILEKKDNNVMKRFMSSGGCIEPITDSITSPKFFRTPLLSGGSFTEIVPHTEIQENLHQHSQQQHQKHKKHELPSNQHVQPKMMIPITPLTPSLSTPNILSGGGISLSGQHFQFPPINSITGFNPLTLPPINISHSPVLPNGEKVIPYVPGIPGPNTLSLQLPPPPQRLVDFTTNNRNSSPNRKRTTSPLVQESGTNDQQQNFHYRNSVQNQKYQQKPIIRIENTEISSSPSILQISQNESTSSSNKHRFAEQQPQRSPKIHSVWTPNAIVEPQPAVQRKSFNFTRMADNISPKKPEKVNLIKSISTKEPRHFNFENLSTIKTEFKTEELQPLHVDCPSTAALTVVPSPLSSNSLLEPILPLQSPQNTDEKLSTTGTSAKKTKFLRPTSLPLKPGTFTPKRHHGITPTANTMPLISPETPRPSKTCGQMFLNGHAYTYLGLKCSTKMFYCTVNCPQPSYVANLHKLSMYSVWQVQAEKNLHPLGLKPKTVMALYDSRQRNCTGLSMANIKLPYTSVHSQHTVMTPFENNTDKFYHHQIKSVPLSQITANTTMVSGSLPHHEPTNVANIATSVAIKGTDNQKGPILVGGYESNEDYTYIRGRGRGKYVCSECGIRCKKPSMLVKHIRTHSDIRPYTCLHCNFSFKTKGNLTKHMQSKAHYKKCLELGVDPGEGLNGEFVDREGDNDQQSITSGNDRTSSIPGESDSEYGSDGEDRETESSDTDESKSRLPEHEAAHCLLSLSMTPPSSSVSPHYRSVSQLNNYDNEKHQLINSNNRLDELNNQQNISARRVISFTSPKPPFDYQKQEKYYSNPLIVPKNRPIEKFDENIMKPIDLTKPRSQQIPIVQQLLEAHQTSTTKQSVLVPVENINENSKITDVIGNVSNESIFHKSLLSITDKIRVGGNTDSVEFTAHHPHSQKQNDDILFQAYLTEQALQHTKIKQSQMSSKSFNSDDINKTNIGVIVTTTTTSLVTAGVGNLYYNKNLKKDNINSKSPIITTIPETETTQSVKSPIISTTLITNSILTSKLVGDKLESIENDSNTKRLSPITEQSSTKEMVLDMPRITDSPVVVSESLSDSNFKLNNINTTPIIKDNNDASIVKIINENSQIIRSSSISKQKDNAKSVASEYLKMTLKTNNNSNNSGKLNTEENPDDEDSSDQEISSTINITNTTTTSTDTSNMKPSNDFSGILARTVIVGEDGFKNSTTPTDSQKIFNRVPISDDNGRPICTICTKTFQKQHQLGLHMNIHYMERKFKCEPCAVSFRTQGHLQKHERSEAHKNKVMMTSTFGVPTTSNPRPYECSDCKVAFRIHGHLAKHLRSKTHVQKLECSQKLPFGTYAEIERAGISLTEIDTTDCDNSLASLKILAQKLFEKDPSKLSAYTKPSGMEINSNIIDNNCESGSEDNPDGLDENQPVIPVTSSSTTLVDDNAENRIIISGPTTSTGNCGIKRKFDSFSSCSNDSTTLSGAVTSDNRLNNTTNSISHDIQGSGNSNTGGDEKRLRSTNLTK